MKEPLSPLEAKVEFLNRPQTYGDATTVEAIETHMSWVFLTDLFAYKLKKPVKTSFLDFSTVALRRRFCEEEIRLNRRLAPRVYIETIPLTHENGRMSLGGQGHPIDWLVKMHRLPRERMLDDAIRRHVVRDDQIESLARRLLAFYRAAPRAAVRPRDHRLRLERDARTDLHELALWPHVEQDSIGEVRIALFAFMHNHPGLLEARAAHVLEAHGDLRPEHVFLNEEPQVIDCLEFSRQFRTLDPVDELAFFAVECEMLGAPAIGTTVFARYCEGSKDVPHRAIFDFYRSCRAALRAKLSIWHLREERVRDPKRWPRQARRYLDVAAAYSQRLS